MPVSPEHIRPNAVFLTPRREQRRVWAVRDGKVHYFAKSGRPGSYWTPGHPPHMAPTVDLFCAEVEHPAEHAGTAQAKG